MADNNSVIKINQLPEKNDLAKSDWLLVEDTEDTKKVRASVFNDYVDEQVDLLSVSIQNQMNEASETINTISANEEIRKAKFAEIEKKEADYEANELIRKNNEATRTETFTSWTTETTQAISAESDRKEAEANRVAAEKNRVTTEINRVNSEKTRVSSETDRETKFAKMQQIIDAVNDSETSRNKGYSNMVAYFNNVKTMIDDRSSVGLSKTTTATNMVARVATIELLKDSDNLYGLLNSNPYTILLHVVERLSTGNVKSGFVFCALKVVDSAVESKLYASSLNTISKDNIKVVANKVSTGIEVTVEYKAVNIGAVIECHRLSDNLVMFGEDYITSHIEKSWAPKMAFNTTGTTLAFDSISDIQKNSLPANMELQLIGLMEQLQVIRTEMSDMAASINIAPYTMYPVGSIFESSVNTDPSELLGGGTWKLICGTTETITDEEGATVYSYDSYKWLRVADTNS